MTIIDSLPMAKPLKLSELNVNDEAVIYNTGKNIRLNNLGIIPGNKIKVFSKYGDMIIIKILGTTIGVACPISDEILVLVG